MKKLTVGSLFTGIGGFDLGLEMSGGFEIEWQVEIDPFCKKVLAKHWPDVARYGDIREVGKHNLQPVDLIAGGFPCQPHSLAGKRQASADERDLWGEFYRIVCELKPRWVLAENVVGLLSSEDGSFFGRVLRDLAQAGYDAQWIVRRASDVGAPHRRERVFIMAYLPSVGGDTWRTEPEGQQWTPNVDRISTSDLLSHTDSNRQRIGQVQQERQSECKATANASHDGTQGTVADATGAGLSQWGSDRLTSDATQVDTGLDSEPQRYSIMEHTSSAGRQELHTSTISNSEGYTAGRSDETGIKRTVESRLGGDADGVSPSMVSNRGDSRGMDGDSVIAGAILEGGIEVDFEMGLIYSRRIRGKEGQRIPLSGAVNYAGYIVHKISYNGVKKVVRAHRIVWIAANGPIPEGLVVDHINRNRSDNRLSNLRLVDAQGNAANRLSRNGENNPVAKLTEAQVQNIRELRQQGLFIRDIAARCNISKSQVHNIISGKSWKEEALPHRWPAGPGEQQYDWEPERVVTGKQPHRVARLKALGNAIVPQLVTEIGRDIIEFENSRVL
jgi:DNA (cytosine-5)-methyltransferase 1